MHGRHSTKNEPVALQARPLVDRRLSRAEAADRVALANFVRCSPRNDKNS